MPPERKSQPRNPELAALGKAIEERIAEQGMTQKSLATASSIDIRRIGDYVRGQHNPSYTNLKPLCQALGITPSKLMDRADELREDDPKS